jgi:hypothetical protein
MRRLDDGGGVVGRLVGEQRGDGRTTQGRSADGARGGRARAAAQGWARWRSRRRRSGEREREERNNGEEGTR